MSSFLNGTIWLQVSFIHKPSQNPLTPALDECAVQEPAADAGNIPGISVDKSSEPPQAEWSQAPPELHLLARSHYAPIARRPSALNLSEPTADTHAHDEPYRPVRFGRCSGELLQSPSCCVFGTL